MEIGNEICSNILLVFIIFFGCLRVFWIVIILLRGLLIFILVGMVLLDVGVGLDRFVFLLVCDWRIWEGRVEVMDMGFLVIIIILVDLVGDKIEGLFDCDWSILFGRVIWGIIMFIDNLLVLLVWFSVCCGSVIVGDGDKVVGRFVFMFDIIVMCMFFKGFGLMMMFLFFGLIWCMCIIGLFGRCVLFNVWVIVVGFRGKIYVWKV